MIWWFIIQIVVAVALAVLSYALTPKPKKQKPAASKDLPDPTSEAGRPIPIVLGTLTVTSPNVLWWGDKGKHEYETAA